MSRTTRNLVERTPIRLEHATCHPRAATVARAARRDPLRLRAGRTRLDRSIAVDQPTGWNHGSGAAELNARGDPGDGASTTVAVTPRCVPSVSRVPGGA